MGRSNGFPFLPQVTKEIEEFCTIPGRPSAAMGDCVGDYVHQATDAISRLEKAIGEHSQYCKDVLTFFPEEVDMDLQRKHFADLGNQMNETSENLSTYVMCLKFSGVSLEDMQRSSRHPLPKTLVDLLRYPDERTAVLEHFQERLRTVQQEEAFTNFVGLLPRLPGSLPNEELRPLAEAVYAALRHDGLADESLQTDWASVYLVTKKVQVLNAYSIQISKKYRTLDFSAKVTGILSKILEFIFNNRVALKTSVSLETEGNH